MGKPDTERPLWRRLTREIMNKRIAEPIDNCKWIRSHAERQTEMWGGNGKGIAMLHSIGFLINDEFTKGKLKDMVSIAKKSKNSLWSKNITTGNLSLTKPK